MAKANVLIALLVIFILPVFISSYDKYSNLSYSDMNYNDIGREYTNYFSEGMDEISIISDIGELAITVTDYIKTAIDWVMDAIEWIMDAFGDIIGFFKDLLEIDDDNTSPPRAELPDFVNPGTDILL